MADTEMTTSGAIKAYMGEGDGYPPVTSAELMLFAKADKAGYKWMGEECARELGATIRQAQ